MMRARLPALVCSVLLVALQYPLWLGHGGLFRVHALEHELADQRSRNLQQQHDNRALEAEVHDLATGSAAIEERARTELGMVREGERWFRYPHSGNPAPAPASQP